MQKSRRKKGRKRNQNLSVDVRIFNSFIKNIKWTSTAGH